MQLSTQAYSRSHTLKATAKSGKGLRTQDEDEVVDFDPDPEPPLAPPSSFLLPLLPLVSWTAFGVLQSYIQLRKVAESFRSSRQTAGKRRRPPVYFLRLACDEILD